MSDSGRRDAWLKSVIGFDVEAAVAAAEAPRMPSDMLSELKQKTAGQRARADAGAVEGMGKVEVLATDDALAADTDEEAAAQESTTPETVSSAAPQTEEEWNKLHDTLNWLLLRVSDYAEDADQERDWTTRLLKMLDGHAARDAAIMPMIDALGAELRDAAAARKTAEGPLKEWNKGFAKFRQQAEVSAQSRLDELEGAEETRFRAIWDAVDKKFDDLDEGIEDAFDKAAKVSKDDRVSKLTKALNDAETILKDLVAVKDDAGDVILPGAVERGLKKQLAVLQKAVTESK